MRTTESLLSGPQVTVLNVEMAAELAACLRRFLSATADELTMRRAQAALESWDASDDLSRSRPTLS